MKYRIRDLQFGCRYFGGDEPSIFNSKKEVLEQLADYHDIDYDGVRDDDTPYKNIWEWLNENYTTDEEKLNAILVYGEWELEEVPNYEEVYNTIHNFIIYFTSDDKEREDMTAVLDDYMENGEPFC